MSAAIAVYKHASDRRLKMRPRREAEIIARVTARARRAPPELVEQMWRALMSHGLQEQVHTEILLCAPADDGTLRDLVARRFGPAASIRSVAAPGDAIGAARAREAVAVIAKGVSYTLQPGDDVVMFETLDDAAGRCRAEALGRVAPADAVVRCGGAG